MKKSFLISTSLLLIAGLAYGQTVTSYAGKVNSDPNNNYSNTTADLADAYFYQPQGIGWDDDGNMYVTESNKIRLLINGKAYNRSGKLGDPSFSLGYANGTGIAGHFYSPTDIVGDGTGDMYIVDSENHAIRKLTAYSSVANGQMVSTFAGAAPNSGWGTSGYKDGSGTAARFDSPKGITRDGSGNFYVTDMLNHCIRKISSSGNVTTLAGKGGESGNTDATGGANVRFSNPYGIALLDANTLVITDFGNSAIKKVDISTGTTTTICGGFGNKNGSFSEARFRSVRGIAVVDGLIYVADGTSIRVIDQSNKTVSTFAGSLTQSGNTDGVGENARFGNLFGLAYDGADALFVTDQTNHVVKKVTIDNLAPDADFSVSKENIGIGEETTISDISGGKPATKRKWTVVNNGTGKADAVIIVQGDLNADKDVTLKFSATGVYKVTLNVTNEYGNDEVSKAIINVSTVGIRRVDQLADFNIYPNPASDGVVNLKLNSGSFDHTTIQLLDMNGKVVRETTVNYGSEASIPVTGVNKGIYFLKVSDENMAGMKKVMIN